MASERIINPQIRRNVIALDKILNQLTFILKKDSTSTLFKQNILQKELFFTLQNEQK